MSPGDAQALTHLANWSGAAKHIHTKMTGSEADASPRRAAFESGPC
jgi:hypothetical protein